MSHANNPYEYRFAEELSHDIRSRGLRIEKSSSEGGDNVIMERTYKKFNIVFIDGEHTEEAISNCFKKIEQKYPPTARRRRDMPGINSV